MDANPSRVNRISTQNADEFGELLADGGVLGCAVSPLGAEFEGEVVIGASHRLLFIASRLDRTRLLHRNFEQFDQISINIPLAAPLRFRTGLKTHDYSIGTAYFRGPGDEFDLTTPSQSTFLGLALSRELVTWLSKKLGRPFTFSGTLSLETPEGQSFYRYLNFIWAEIQRGGTLMNTPLAAHEIENSLASLLYAATLRSNRGEGTGGIFRPHYLQCAEEYIRANLTRPLSVLDIATVAGVAPGTLSRAFRKHRGMTTKDFVTQRRLEAAQRKLLAAAPDSTTVTEVATSLGFHHLGRFALAYRLAFGETPSETLRR